jgi:hypothetical protein
VFVFKLLFFMFLFLVFFRLCFFLGFWYINHVIFFVCMHYFSNTLLLLHLNNCFFHYLQNKDRKFFK